MKTLFIRARSNIDVASLAREIHFDGVFGLVASVQHVSQLDEVKKFLPKSIIGGQVIGCDISKAKRIAPKVDAFLFIGSGNFHPVQIAMETGKEVYTADPFTGQIGKIPEEEIEERKKRIKAGYIAFLHAERIGILVSTKKGQNKLKEAKRLKAGLAKKKKASFIFVFDTLDFSQLANFPDIQCWVNTACPRIAIEDYKKFPKPVVNMAGIPKQSI